MKIKINKNSTTLRLNNDEILDFYCLIEDMCESLKKKPKQLYKAKFLNRLCEIIEEGKEVRLVADGQN